MDAAIMNKIPESIMKHHDPNDDPFAGLADDSNQLVSPLQYGSGISYLVHEKPQEEVMASSTVVKSKDGEAKQENENSSAESTQNEETAAPLEVEAEK